MNWSDVGFWGRAIATLCATVALVAALAVILCSVTRCKRCRGWHDEGNDCNEQE